MATRSRSPIHECLAAERRAVGSLVTLLRSEQGCLSQASVLALSTLTPEKAALVADVSELTRQRHRALADAGYAPDDLGMRAWLNSDAGRSSDKAWAETLDLLRTAQELNMSTACSSASSCRAASGFSTRSRAPCARPRCMAAMATPPVAQPSAGV